MPLKRPFTKGISRGVVPSGGGGGVGASAALIAKLQAPPNTKNVMLEYVSATERYVWTPADDARLWVRWTLTQQATGFWSLSDSRIFDAISGVAAADGGNTYSGSWTTVSQGQSLGGAYRHASANGAYVEFTFTGADHLYIVHGLLSNGGYATVTIDGSTALVNELVNGQLSSYKAGTGTFNNRTKVASGLNPATSYTVRVTATGTKPADSTDTRVYFEGYGHEVDTLNDATVYGVTLAAKPLKIFGGSATWEYAIQYKPPSPASVYEWTGSGHENEAVSAVTFEDGSGNDISVDSGTPRRDASKIVVEMSGTARHSETGTTDHAIVVSRSTFDNTGLTVYHRHDWLTSCDIAFAYPAMFSCSNNQTNRGIVAGDAPYDLTPNDDTWHGQRQERALAIWQSGTNYVACLYLDDFTPVNNWADSDAFAFVEDRGDGTLNKMYIQRVGGANQTPNAVVGNGDVWESTAHYRVTHFENPDTNL
jgi:hypothetical protein